jgi:hypothetical protein
MMNWALGVAALNKGKGGVPPSVRAADVVNTAIAANLPTYLSSVADTPISALLPGVKFTNARGQHSVLPVLMTCRGEEVRDYYFTGATPYCAEDRVAVSSAPDEYGYSMFAELLSTHVRGDPADPTNPHKFVLSPEDDMRLTNPPTNPALLDALAKHFVDHGYDLKDLIRTICRSTTYQLTADPNESNADDRQSYSRFYPRRLTAEVSLDAIDQLTEKPTQFSGVLPGTRAVQLPDPNFNNYFLTVFGRPSGDSPCECERGTEANLAQMLHLINSPDILGKLGSSRAARLAADTGRTTQAKLDEIYMVAFARPPSASEIADVESYLASHEANLPAAWEDVIWSILNTKEFLFTH